MCLIPCFNVCCELWCCAVSVSSCYCLRLTSSLLSLYETNTVSWVDKIQGLCWSRHGYTGPPWGEAGQRNPEAHQLGSGTKAEARVLLTVESGWNCPSVMLLSLPPVIISHSHLITSCSSHPSSSSRHRLQFPALPSSPSCSLSFHVFFVLFSCYSIQSSLIFNHQTPFSWVKPYSLACDAPQSPDPSPIDTILTCSPAFFLLKN